MSNKVWQIAFFALTFSGGNAAATRSGDEDQVSPIQQVIKMMTNMQAKITRDGEVEEKAYKEYFEWCDDAARTLFQEIKTSKSKVEKLSATIDKSTSDIDDATTHIEELSGSLSTDEADLKAATHIREKENKDFVAAEKELMEAVDMLGRAIGILERELKGSAFLQKLDTSNLRGLISGLSTILDSVSVNSHDKQKLLTLVQSSGEVADDAEDRDAEDRAFGAPAPDAYQSKSGGIVDILVDMKDKAETELAEARKTETKAQHNYDMLKQSLTDSIAASNHEMSEQKSFKAEAEETKAAAEGELDITSKDLKADESELHEVQMGCMEAATNHEISMKGRKEELAALAKAKKIVQEATTLMQSAPSLIQVAALSRVEVRGNQVLSILKRLAKDNHSLALTQLVSRIAATMRYSTHNGEDPFAKIKGLISDMIAKLMKEAQEEAEEKAYCDEEMGKTKAKKDELTGDIESLTSKIDEATSASTRLKDEVKTLQKELADMQALQQEMDKAREDEHAAFLESTGDLQKGLDGIRKALEVLREYYGGKEDSLLQTSDDANFDAFMQQPAPPAQHEKSSGAGGSIISLLEVAESDFAKNLAEENSEEEAAQEEYDKITEEHKITKVTKEQDVKYKTKEHKTLDKNVAELSSDREGLQTELDAVLEYYDKIKEKCVAKPEPYEERKKRREAEIKGLKQALSILQGEALLQGGSRIRVHA